MSTVTPRDLDPMPTSQSGSTQNELYAIGDDTNYRETNTRDIKNITGSGNLSETLTAPSEGVGEILIGRYGAGTGTATFNAPASVDILWPDGATTSSVVFEGNGVAVLTSVGADLYVKEYEDSISIADSGNDVDRKVTKLKNGDVEFSGKLLMTFSAISSSQATATLGYTLNSVRWWSAYALDGYGILHFFNAGARSNTLSTFTIHAIDNNAANRTGSWNAPYSGLGRWR